MMSIRHGSLRNKAGERIGLLESDEKLWPTQEGQSQARKIAADKRDSHTRSGTQARLGTSVAMPSGIILEEG